MRSSEDSEFPSVCFLLPKRLLRAGCWDVGVCRGAKDPTRPLFHLPSEYLFGSCMLSFGSPGAWKRVLSPGIANMALGGQEKQVGEIWLNTGRALASSSPVPEWRLHLFCKYLWKREWPFHTLHSPAASPVPTRTAVLRQSKPVSF